MANLPNYRVPQVCARCGAEKVDSKWELNTPKGRTKDRSTLRAILDRMKGKKPAYRFNLPVCRRCLRILMLTQVGIQLFVLLLTFTGGWFAARFAAEPGQGIFLGLGGGGLGLVLGLLLVPLLKSAAKANLGSFDGTHFKFQNPAFREAFRVKNPNLVK